MSQSPPGTPARLFFSPMHDGSAAPETDAGLLSDLFLCRSTGRFFTLPSAEITVEPRSSRSAKQFFCPVCPKSPLKLSSSSSMLCPSCGWDAARTGVSSVAELLQRDGDPFPWITTEIRRLAAQLNQPHEDAALLQETAPLGVPRTSSLHRLSRKRHSLRHIERQKPEHQLSKAESASLCAQKFAEKQAEREKRVFAEWMPKLETPFWAGPGKPEGNVDEMRAEVDMDELIELDERICKTTWKKRELAARRRVPPPKVSVRSPYGGGKTKRAGEFAPDIFVWIRNGCADSADGSEENGVEVRIHNKQELGGLRVTVVNANESKERANATVAEGDTAMLTIDPFSFCEKRCPEMVDSKMMCDRVATLDVGLQYITADGPGHISWLRSYARHAI